jgi:hypothetical protein
MTHRPLQDKETLDRSPEYPQRREVTFTPNREVQMGLTEKI